MRKRDRICNQGLVCRDGRVEKELDFTLITDVACQGPRQFAVPNFPYRVLRTLQLGDLGAKYETDTQSCSLHLFCATGLGLVFEHPRARTIRERKCFCKGTSQSSRSDV